MAERLFKREVVLTIAAQNPQTFHSDIHNAIVIKNLRVIFNIEKSLDKEPNKLTLKVYNLSDATRAALRVLPIHVRLEAGYEGRSHRLFAGDLRHAYSNVEGPDIITQIEVGDGERAFSHARVQKSLAPGVTAKAAAKEIAKSMGLDVNDFDDQAIRWQYAQGLTLNGPARKELERVLKPRGFEYSVQDGRLQVLKKGAVRPDQAILVSQDTGMIGSPQMTPPSKTGEKPTLKVQMLCHPRLMPGGKIVVKSKLHNGLFRVERVTHTGDNWGDEWTSDIEAKPV